MSKEHYYIETTGTDDEAYREAMAFACRLADKDPEIKRVVLLVATKKNIGWFERLYGYDIAKRLFRGVHFKDCKPLFQFETRLTYREGYTPSEVVITCGLDDKDVLKIGDYMSPKVIIAIPWILEKLQKYIQTWKPIELRSQAKPANSFPEPSCVVKTALIELTESINTTTGITHPMDNDRAKTYIRSLHKYEDVLDANTVGAYLVGELDWDTDHAKDVETLINKLNDGKYFQGGETTGLQNYYKRWKKECGKNVKN